MEIAKLVLQYLQVVLSWPVMALGLVLLFKDQISDALTRIASIRLPGGSELVMPQAAANVLAATVTDQRTTPAVGEPPASAENAEDRVKTERERATLWEYRFLNYFLVPRTQLVLDWLAARPPMGILTYDSWLLESVPNPTERFAVLDALRNHLLIDVQDGNQMIAVTAKGREYIRWRGPAINRLGPAAATLIPPPPPAPENAIAAPAHAGPGSP